MKVRFYCDVPPMFNILEIFNILERPRFLTAQAGTPIKPAPAHWQRIFFDVEFPSDVLQDYKEIGIEAVSNVAVITEEEK